MGSQLSIQTNLCIESHITVAETSLKEQCHGLCNSGSTLYSSKAVNNYVKLSKHLNKTQ